MEEAKFPAFELKQNGKVFYLTYMNAEELADNTEADTFNAHTKKGYQRRVSEARAKAFRTFMTNEHGVSPTAIILSYRDKEPIFKAMEKTHNFGLLTLKNEKFWQVDGQHRILGLKELVSASRGIPPSALDKELLFPVIIICPALWGEKNMENIKFQEAYQFYVINKTQRGVASELTDEFMAQLKKRIGLLGIANEPLPSSMTRNASWTPNAIDIVDEMNKSSEVWRSKILLANEQPHAGTFVAQKAFTDSLNPVLKSDIVRSIPESELIRILEIYWSAIRNEIPEAYTEYTKYVLFRRTGVFVMHSVFPDIASLITNYICPITKATENTFKEIIDIIPEMSSDQWKNDSEWGNMGTSHKAIKVIADTIRDSLRTNFKQ